MNCSSKRSGIALAIAAGFSLFFIPHSALANSENANVVASPQKDKGTVYGSLLTYYTSNFYSPDAYDSERSIGVDGKVGYKFANQQKLSLLLSGYDAIDGETQGQYWNDGWIRHQVPMIYSYSDWLNIGAEDGLRLPLSEQSRLDDLRTALRVGLPIDFYISRWLPGLDITFRPRLAYNFYEYETRGGKNLTEWSLDNLLEFYYQPGTSWSFDLSLVRVTNWTYQGNRTRENLQHIEELGYHFTQNVAVYLNHTNSGSYYNSERGGEGGVSFYDKQHSTWSASFEYLY